MSKRPMSNDDLERLGDEIAELAARLHAATYRLLVLIRDFDANEGWHSGFRTCAHWLSWRTGIALGPAREKVRVARALADLPRIGARMERGELSYSKVRALTRVATRDNEEELLDFALHGTAMHVERLVRAWRRVDRAEDERRHESRKLSLHPDEDGTYALRARLDPEVGALLERALAAAEASLFGMGRRAVGRDVGLGGTGAASVDAREAHGQRCPARERGDGRQLDPTLPEAAQRRADAIGLLAERALADLIGKEQHPQSWAGATQPSASDSTINSAAGGKGRTDRPSGVEARAGGKQPTAHLEAVEPREVERGPTARLPAVESRASGKKHPTPHLSVVETAAGGKNSGHRPGVGSTVGRADRYQVVVHVDATALERDSESGQSALEVGARVPAETSRRIACDSGVVRMVHAPDGRTLDVGRRKRVVPPAIRRALDYRDGGCRFPGCGNRYCDAHHVKHWADGGATKLDNLVLLCRTHHRAVHEGGFGIALSSAGTVSFTWPSNRSLAYAPAPPPVRDPSLIDRWPGHAGDVGPWTATPKWNGELLDLGLAVQVMRAG